jgi:hypothetical protein
MSHVSERSALNPWNPDGRDGYRLERYGLIALGLTESLAATVDEMNKFQRPDAVWPNAPLFETLIGNLSLLEDQLHSILDGLRHEWRDRTGRRRAKYAKLLPNGGAQHRELAV